MNKKAKNIHIEDLTLAYANARKPLLSGVTQTFYSGNIYGITGITGSGKSTFLRSLLDLNDKDQIKKSGAIVIPEDLTFGYVLQQPFTSFNPMYSVRSHLREAFGGNSLSDSQENNINRLLVRYNLQSYADNVYDQMATNFSIGELQRVLWAIALASEPDVLILDEAIAHVDDENGKRFLIDIKKHAEMGNIVFYASHLWKQMKRIADRLFKIVDGEMIPYSLRKERLKIPVTDSPTEEILLKVIDLHYERNVDDGSVEVKEILNDLNFSVAKNETVGIYGDSGAGKSTLAKIIAGRLKQSTGRVQILNQEVRQLGRKVRSSLVQYIPQDPASALTMDMKTNDLIHDIIDNHEVDENYQEFVSEEFGFFTENKNTYVNELSGGQRQLILFYMTLLINPRILILDESLSALDAELEIRLLELLRTWKNISKSGIILISHRRDIIQKYCNKSFFIKNLGKM